MEKSRGGGGGYCGRRGFLIFFSRLPLSFIAARRWDKKKNQTIQLSNNQKVSSVPVSHFSSGGYLCKIEYDFRHVKVTPPPHPPHPHSPNPLAARRLFSLSNLFHF